VAAWSSLRAEGKFAESRQVLARIADGREDELRAELFQRIDAAHEAFCTRIPDNVVVTYGNVDVPDLMRKYLAPGVRFVDAEVVDIGGVRFGFVGGGLPKVGIPGEVPLDVYTEKVSALGPADVLCAHVPPAIDDLTFDVKANFNEPGSTALLEYISEHEPSHVYFGHVHQPRQARMRMGSSVLVNVGHHYRTTGTALQHPAGETA
jgi:Icc-related predicted phosphoesterase